MNINDFIDFFETECGGRVSQTPDGGITMIQLPNLSDTSLPDTKAGLPLSEQRESTQGKIDSHQTKTQK